MNLSPKKALIIFIALVTFVFAQAVWWVVFMATLVNEKVELAQQLGGSEEFVQAIHQEEISRQIMLGMEGVVFLLLILAGIWLIYRSLVRAEDLKFHQQNFLMAVTHELKTPLASMKIYLDSLESEKIPMEKKLSVVLRLRDDLRRLEKMVSNILEAGRFERAGYHLNKDVFDFSSLLEEIVSTIEARPQAIPLTIEKQIEPNVYLDGDRYALGQAVGAILENSLKYHELGDIRIRVTLRTDAHQAYLTVSDNGIGLEKKNLREVFERFYRVGNEMTRRAEGSGLGLYLCREIIRAHGGKVTAHSEGLGRGTEFRIVLKRGMYRETNSAG